MACNLPKLDLCIRRGATIDLPIRVESARWQYIPIEDIEQSAPIRITATGHGLADRWRGVIVNVQGMTEINSTRPLSRLRDQDYLKFDATDPDTLEVNDINAAAFSAYVSGGQIVAPLPLDVSEFESARMQVNDASGEQLAYWTTDDALALDTTHNAIRLQLTAEESAALTWTAGFYDIELVTAGGVVRPIVSATSEITIAPEQTTAHEQE
jgi:hypothetical protein